MKVIPANSASILQVTELLRSGGVIAHATETCYGLACDLMNPAAVAKLFAIKQRSADQPVSALFSSIDAAKQYVVFSSRALELAAKHLPGPLTIVLPKNSHTPYELYVCPPSHRQATIGVRISSHPLTQELVEQFGKPLATTSANLHGHPNPYSLADILSQFPDTAIQPGLVIDSGTLPPSPPSTVIEIIDDQLRVLRQGELVIS